jgi:hypothetical protein
MVDDEALSQLAAIEPIDTHLHAYQDVPAVADLFSRLNLRALNVLLIDDRDPFAKSMEPQWTDALAVQRLTKGRAVVCTTIDPYGLESPGFVARVNKRLNADFDAGAIAVKLYKVVGMEVRRKDGTYVLPDDAAFSPIFHNIAAHHKSVLAHVAEPDSCWKAPDPASPDYSYYNEHPEEYAYKHPGPGVQRLGPGRAGTRPCGCRRGNADADFLSNPAHGATSTDGSRPWSTREGATRFRPPVEVVSTRRRRDGVCN